MVCLLSELFELYAFWSWSYRERLLEAGIGFMLNAACAAMDQNDWL